MEGSVDGGLDVPGAHPYDKRDDVADLSSRGWQNVDGGDAASYASALIHGRMTSRREDAVALLGVERGSVVLDIGCGVGDLLAAVGIGAVRIGVDRSVRLLEHVVLHGLPAVQGLGEYLPFQSASADRVHIERVLLHVDAPELAIAEVFRVLMRQGRALLTEPDWLSFTVNADRELASFVEGTFRAGVRQPDIGRHLEGLVEHAGLVVERVDVLPVTKEGAHEVDPRGVVDGLLAEAVSRGEISTQALVAWRNPATRVSSTSKTFRVLAIRPD